MFLLVDCSAWALIVGHIEKQRVHSVLWQFWTGGSIVSFTQVKLTFPDIFLLDDLSLYFPIRWPFLIFSY